METGCFINVLKNKTMRVIFFLFCFIPFLATSQELVSESTEYLPYQDSLFLIKTVTVKNNGLTVNDTSVTYSTPLDAASLINSLSIGYTNNTGQAVARWRNNNRFSRIFADYAEAKASISAFGVNLDSLNVDKFGAAFIGRWRVFNHDGSSYFVNIDYHPARGDLLRATSETDGAFYNIVVYSRWFFRITVSGVVKYVMWDGSDSARPIFRDASFGIPAQMVTRDNFRMIKVD